MDIPENCPSRQCYVHAQLHNRKVQLQNVKRGCAATRVDWPVQFIIGYTNYLIQKNEIVSLRMSCEHNGCNGQRVLGTLVNVFEKSYDVDTMLAIFDLIEGTERGNKTSTIRPKTVATLASSDSESRKIDTSLMIWASTMMTTSRSIATKASSTMKHRNITSENNKGQCLQSAMSIVCWMPVILAIDWVLSEYIIHEG